MIPILTSVALALFARTPILTQTDGGSFDSEGVKIRYIVAGEGEPVVLIHGWMADATMWGSDGRGNARLDTSEAEGFRLIAFDCRGHGKSDKPRDPARYGEEMAEDAIRLLDHLHIDRAHFVGYSMGAFLVGKIATDHPKRVISTIYAGQAPLISEEEIGVAKEVRVFAEAVKAGKGLGPYIAAIMPPDRPKPTPEQADALAKIMFTGKDLQALADAGFSFPSLRVTPAAFRKTVSPTLFLYGEKESADVKDSVARARALRPDAEEVVVPGGDHATTLLKPGFGQSILRFLRSHRSGHE